MQRCPPKLCTTEVRGQPRPAVSLARETKKEKEMQQNREQTFQSKKFPERLVHTVDSPDSRLVDSSMASCHCVHFARFCSVLISVCPAEGETLCNLLQTFCSFCKKKQANCPPEVREVCGLWALYPPQTFDTLTLFLLLHFFVVL